ncbi:preprotein translocase subunit SecY [Candidatus Woesearchaeota archaeon]|nr:preprotein translocase subunit SecY [Candidatus Woesearchaeota archaeon]
MAKAWWNFLPEVAKPDHRLSFQEKLKWTGIVLLLFFALGFVPLFGLSQNQLSRFEFLSVILGASFGSIISLGIGPIVTASIVLQLLNGSGILKFDTSTPEGKKKFQEVNKGLGVFFIIFEAAVYVFMSGLSPDPALRGTTTFFLLELLLIFQLCLGGLLIMLMDDLSAKWGIGSGISLFIAAGVSQSLFIRLFSPLSSPTNPGIATGAIPALFQSFASGDPQGAFLLLTAVISTVLVFALAVYVQSMKVEIPLSFGRVRGFGIRWPLSFVYTSNIPVILVAALMANVQLWGQLLQNVASKPGASTIIVFLSEKVVGQFSGSVAISGAAKYLTPVNALNALITRGFIDGFLPLIPQLIIFIIIFVGLCVLFSWFWVQTAGMDAKSQAKQIMASGLQVPGFRKDERVVEALLQRYITPLTVMGAITVGILAAITDVSGALTSGTGLLLTVMIVYRFYEDIARTHMMDMNPLMRKFMGG